MEEGDLQIRALLANEARSQPEVVVMHPYRCTFSCFGTGRLGETTIDLFKYGPIGVIDVEMGREGMKNWPEAFL